MFKSRDMIRRIIGEGTRRAQGASQQRGFLGEPLGNGQFDFEGLKPGRMLARLVQGPDDTVTGIVEVINERVARNPAIRIILDKNKDGEWFVVGRDHNYSMESTGDNPGLLTGVGPHSHRIGFGLEDLVEFRRFEPGLVHVDTNLGLLVFVEAFPYRHDGVDKYWAGGTIDLTSYRPTTTLYFGWVRVGLNPATNTLVAVKGTEYATETSLTIADLLGIAFLNYISLAGVKLRQGQTAINAESMFQEARLFAGSMGAGGEDIYPLVVTNWM